MAHEVYVDGFFNGGDIRELNSLLLKTRGNQVLEAPFAFDNLTAPEVVLINGQLSGKTSADLISIKQGTYVIDQTVEFEEPVYAKTLALTERINNLQVLDGKLDVLLKNASQPQIVSGDKLFENVQLQSPISLQGKINSESLTNMNPVSIFDEDLVLEGNYEINGEVNIQEHLDAADIVGRSGTYSALRLQRYGLPLHSNYSGLHFTFTQPIRVKNLFTRPTASFNPDDFVKTGTDQAQLITGFKHFTDDLVVKQGICEADEINRVDLKKLDTHVLKHSGDQVVKGRIQFDKIATKSVAALKATLGKEDVDFNNLLSLDLEQAITSPVVVQGPLVVQHNLEAANLYSHGQFNDNNLEHVIRDTVLNDGRDYHVTGEKSFENLDVHSLKFSQVGRLNGIEMGTIAWDLDIFSEKYIYINESTYLPNSLKIANLEVEGSINGVPREVFGKAWLLAEGDQEFTAPVTLNHAIFQENVEVDGAFNGYDWTYLYENTIWTNEDQKMGDVQCGRFKPHLPYLLTYE